EQHCSANDAKIRSESAIAGGGSCCIPLARCRKSETLLKGMPCGHSDRGLPRECLPNLDRAVEFIHRLQDLQAKVGVQARSAEKLMHLGLGGGRLLTADEGVQPIQQKENLALTLDLRQGLQGRLQIRPCEL